MPKVMIGVPIDTRKLYVWDEFKESIKKLNADEIVICDTSKDKGMMPKIESEGFISLYTYKEKQMDRLVSARNMLRNYFLKNDFDYLLWLDSDIITPLDTIKTLLSHNKDIVSGLCLVTDEKGFPTPATKFKNKGLYYKFPMDMLDNKIHKVDYLGFGCMLVKKEVMSKLPIRCMRDEFGGLFKTDDCCFSEDAIETGYELFIDTGLSTRHHWKGQWDLNVD